MHKGRRIDPWVDCVAKALLADEANKALLIDLLNGVLAPSTVIEDVELLNPHLPEEYVGDKLAVVDVKARDTRGHTFHVELQMLVRPKLPGRMLYTWAELFRSQLRRGEDYGTLRPVVSVWIVGERLFRDDDQWRHTFEIIDRSSQRRLSEHLRIDVIEVPKWRATRELAGLDRWVYFFKEARHWDSLPPELNDPTMEAAMAVLKMFSEREVAYLRYAARQDEIRERATWVRMMDEAVQDVRAAQADRDAAVAMVEAALAAAEAAKAAAKATVEAAEAAKAEAKAMVEAAKAEAEAKAKAEAKAEAQAKAKAEAEAELLAAVARAEAEAAAKQRLIAALQALGVDPDTV